MTPERRKITKDALARLKLPEGKAEHTIWDVELRGFGVRIRKAGSRNFIVKYRVGGIDRQMTIGPASPDGLAGARAAAAKALQSAKAGIDPQVEKVQRHQDARETLGELVSHYLAQAVTRQRPNTFSLQQRQLKELWKPLHSRAVRSVATRDVAQRLDDITAKNGPVASNRARTALSALYVWAMKRGRATANPVIGTDKNEERSRDRVLSRDELRGIWLACGERGEFGRIVRLLILTGCRRQEVGSMQWEELSPSLDLWTIPSARTKNGVAHNVALAPLAREVLQEQPRRLEGLDRSPRSFVFGEGRKGYAGWAAAKAGLELRIAKDMTTAAGQADTRDQRRLAPWTLHDLRRTFATVCAEELHIEPHVIEACLNHVRKRREGVAGIYNRATYAAPMARAWRAYADWIIELVTGEEAATNVVELRR